MVFRSTPTLGSGLEDVIAPDGVWFDVPGKMTLISPRLGERVMGTDGHQFVLVQASAAIASATPGTQVTITTDDTWKAATGAGGYTAPAGKAVPINGFFYARRTLTT